MQNDRTISGNYQENSSRPTLAQLEHARPYRPDGPPERCKSHKTNVLKFWIECARQGRAMLGSELYAHPELYGRSPRNRISELKKDGYIFESTPRGSNDQAYRLLRGPHGEAYAPADWYERQTGKQRPRWQARPFSEKRLAEDDCFVLTPPVVTP